MEDQLSLLAAAIAHEVKNPISLVSANIDLMELCDKDKVYENNYLMMRRELNKINDIIMSLVDLTRLPDLDLQEVGLCRLISEAARPYRESLSGIMDITIKCRNKGLTIPGREKSLSLMFSNIIKNAVDSIRQRQGGEKGFIHIIIANDKSRVTVQVKDNGGGLSEEAREKIGKGCFTTKKEGSGLGIMICNKIAAEHGGTFSLNSWERGCVATVILPKN